MTVEFTWWFLWGLLIALFAGFFIIPFGMLDTSRSGRWIVGFGVAAVLLGCYLMFVPGVGLT